MTRDGSSLIPSLTNRTRTVILSALFFAAGTPLTWVGGPASSAEPAPGVESGASLQAPESTGQTAAPVSSPAAVTEHKLWDILEAPMEEWELEHPEWLRVKPGPGGLRLEFHFPDRPAAAWDGYIARAIHRIQVSTNLAGYDGVRFEARSEVPSCDWSLDVVLARDDGLLYVDRAAVTPDREGWVNGIALFKDFALAGRQGAKTSVGPGGASRGDAVPFAPDGDGVVAGRIRGVGFGVIHRAGDSNVFSLRNLELIKTAPSAAPSAANTAFDVRVDPGRVLTINGETEAPPGIFGLDIADPEAAADPGAIAAARDLRPGWVRILHTDGEGSPDNARLSVYQPGSREEAIVRGTNASGWLLAVQGAGRPPNSNEAWAEAVTADAARDVRNTPREMPAPQLEIWSRPERRASLGSGPAACDVQALKDDPGGMGDTLGPIGRDVYASIYEAAQRQVKQSLPELAVGGFSTGLPGGEDGRLWETWWRPLLDRLAGNYDFLTEQHYGIGGSAYEANLMLLAAYTLHTRGRITPIYSTVDSVPAGEPPGVEAGDTPDDAWRAAEYEITDTLAMLREPDKVKARAAGPYPARFARGGRVADESQRLPVYWAHWVMQDLRGLRLPVSPTLGNDVEVVASLDGDRVVILLYNHAGEARAVHLLAPAPRGAHYTSVLERRLGRDAVTGQMLLEKGKESPIQGATFDLGVTLPGRTLASYALHASRKITPEQTWEVGDAFADRYFLTIYPGHAESMRVYLPDMNRVASVELRLAMQGVGYGAGTAALNGHLLALPYTSANNPAVYSLVVDPGWLHTGANELVITHTGQPGAGRLQFLAAAIRTFRDERYSINAGFPGL